MDCMLRENIFGKMICTVHHGLMAAIWAKGKEIQTGMLNKHTTVLKEKQIYKQ